MKTSRFNSVEDYLTSHDPVKQRTLRSIIDFVLAQSPELECKLAWNVPHIHRRGKYVAGLCAYNNHLTFAPWSPQIIEDFKPRLQNFVVFKNCFQLPVDWQLDQELIKDLVHARLAELEANETDSTSADTTSASAPNPKVDFYFAQAPRWHDELNQLRALVLNCALTEELKWGVPCYTCENGNVVLIHAFKDYCALLFPKGALLKDAHHLLIQQTENSQAARQIRFTSAAHIEEQAPLLKDYIQQATDLEKSGQQVQFKTTSEFPIPEEFQHQLEKLPPLKAAFDALTPGRQRAYLLHFSAPKQAKTRHARVEKSIPQILSGKGLNDH